MEMTDNEAYTGDFILDIWVVIKKGILVITTKNKNLLKHENKSLGVSGH